MKLEDIRKRIDRIDDALFDFLKDRLELSRQAKAAKQRSGKAIKDPEREHAVLARFQQKAKDYGLNPDFITDLYTRILTESNRVQEEGE